MLRKTLVTAIFLAAAVNVSAAKDVVALVNGKAITKADFEETHRQSLLVVTDKQVTKKKTLNDLINRQLGIQKAKKAGLENNPIVRKKLDDILYHAQISKDLEPELKKINITDTDVKNYYKKFPEYRTAHILFRVQVKPTEEETNVAVDHALKVYNTLKAKPDTFPELANKFSQSVTAQNGGDLGYQPAVRLAPEYLKAIKGKSVGYITPPVRTQFGYHIIKVLAVKKFKDINVPLYKKIIYDQRRDSILEQYFSKARKKAKIEILDKSLK